MSGNVASKFQHGKARSWPYKHLSLCHRPLQAAVSQKPTKAALLGVPNSRDVIALLQGRLFTVVPARLNIAYKCQHPLHSRAIAAEGVMPQGQHYCHAAFYKHEISWGETLCGIIPPEVDALDV